MEILKLISAYLFTLVTLFILDILWIEYVAQKLYKKYLSSILKDNINWVSAILFYLVFTFALFIFVVLPVGSWLMALIMGALLGFIMYSVFSFSNMSFIKEWNWKIVAIDILWGSFLGAVSALAAYYIIKLML
jgi:uncharacterized membrane protein